MAHQLAMTSPLITVDIIEANEFPDLAEQYYVYGVPKTIINEKVQFEGAVPERVFMTNLVKATTRQAGLIALRPD